MERQEVPTETDMSHTSEPDTQRGNIIMLMQSFSGYLFFLFYRNHLFHTLNLKAWYSNWHS